LGGYCAVAAGGLGGKVSHWARLAVGVALGLLAWGALGSTLAVLKIGWGAPYRFTAPLVLAAFLAPLVIGPLGVRRAGRLRAALTNRAGLSVLALLHLARVLGLVFLPLHASGELPAHFAYPAAWGDVASALAAPLAAGPRGSTTTGSETQVHRGAACLSASTCWDWPIIYTR
jgi:hypothetical protein